MAGLVALVVALMLVAASCDSDGGDATTAATAPAVEPGAVLIQADPAGQPAFVQQTVGVGAGPVTVVFRNDSVVATALEVVDPQGAVEAGPTPSISDGDEARLEARLTAGLTYEVRGLRGGRAVDGMTATLVVREVGP